MNNAQLDQIKHDFKGAYLALDAIRLFMSRQGVSKTFNCAHPLFFAEMGEYPNGGWSSEVHYSNDAKLYGRDKAGQIYKSVHRLGTNGEQAAINFIEKHASILAGKMVIVDPQKLSYCYGWRSYNYQENDLFLSPVHYCEYSDTIRITKENYCLVNFIDGQFSQPNLDMDGATVKYRGYARNAIGSGFHDCDIKKGQDYCKRRLAWLIGSYIGADFAGSRFCKQDMTKAN